VIADPHLGGNGEIAQPHSAGTIGFSRASDADLRLLTLFKQHTCCST
jgi:hypothetical protein